MRRPGSCSSAPCSSAPRSEEIAIVNQPCAVQHPLDAQGLIALCLPDLSIKNQVATEGKHRYPGAQSGAKGADPWRKAKTDALRLKLVDKAQRSTSLKFPHPSPEFAYCIKHLA